MSVIAWDGKLIAADSQTIYGEIIRKFCKLQIWKGHILGTVGYISVGQQMIEWYKDGANKDNFPYNSQTAEKKADLIVWNKDGIGFYCGASVLTRIEDRFAAWGSGADLAIGAMAMGATAKQAVEVACTHSAYCGLPIDILTLKEQD